MFAEFIWTYDKCTLKKYLFNQYIWINDSCMKIPEIKRWQVLLLSSACLLILAVFSVGYYHPDEHFQILEFAGLKLNLTRPEYLPWEYHFMMRPAIQPAIVVMIHKLFGLFGSSNPFVITVFLRIMSGALSFAAMWMIYRRYAADIMEAALQKWFLLLSFLLWFALYNGVRFSSETWSGPIQAFATSLFELN